MIGALVLRLLFQPELHANVVQHRASLKWAAKHGQSDMNFYWDVLDTVLLYGEKFGKLPTRKSLLEFCNMSDDPGLHARFAMIDAPVREITKNVPQEAIEAISDPDQLIARCVEDARRQWWVNNFKKAIITTLQGRPAGKNYAANQGLYGPEGAMTFLHQQQADDLKAGSANQPSLDDDV